MCYAELPQQSRVSEQSYFCFQLLLNVFIFSFNYLNLKFAIVFITQFRRNETTVKYCYYMSNLFYLSKHKQQIFRFALASSFLFFLNDTNYLSQH